LLDTERFKTRAQVDSNVIQGFLIASGKGILNRHAGYRKPMLLQRAGVISGCHRVFRRICDWRGRVPTAEAKHPMMQAWTHYESPDHLTTPQDSPENWPESIGY